MQFALAGLEFFAACNLVPGKKEHFQRIHLAGIRLALISAAWTLDEKLSAASIIKRKTPENCATRQTARVG
jgi:hypothetical protein